MKSLYRYFLLCTLSCLFFSCSDDDKNNDIPEWNRFRTTNILVYSHLSDMNLFGVSDVKTVAASVRNTNHSVALLDRTNVVYSASSLINTGVEAARDAYEIPVFVPVSYDEQNKKITGSTVLLPKTISKMSQQTVNGYCKYFEIETEAVSGINMLFTSVSMNNESQIEPTVELFKERFKDKTVLVGTVKRSLLSRLESAVNSHLTADTYNFSEVENLKNDSEYCIYILTSKKWAYRGVTETFVVGDINCFQLQVESLK